MKPISTLFCLMLALPAVAWAHGGGLNKQGCHKERATRGYHCHNGERASAPQPQAYRRAPAASTEGQEAPRPASERRPSTVTVDGEVLNFTPYAPAHSAPARAWRRPAASQTEQRLAPAARAAVRSQAPAARSTAPAKPAVTGRHQFYFKNCSEAWLAGHAPLQRGEDGYRAELDPDGNGSACDSLDLDR